MRAPNRTVRSGAATTLAQVYFVRADYAEALRWADEGLEIAETIGNLAGFPAAAAIALARASSSASRSRRVATSSAWIRASPPRSARS